MRESPLARPTADGRGLAVDRTVENLWITTRWTDALPHLRRALGLKWHVAQVQSRSFSFRIVSDEQIRLGNFADRYDGAEPIGALMSPDADLVLVRLGFLGSANKTMPEILRGALMQRVELVQRPIWLIDDPGEPFRQGHLSYSPAVGQYVTDHFTRLALTAPGVP